MHLPSELLAFALSLLALPSEEIAATCLSPAKGCPSSRDVPAAPKGLRGPAVDVSTTVLAGGEPCGVYTLSCAHGLRCMPALGENSPLQALLQGRGICTNGSHNNLTERMPPTGSHAMPSLELEKAPCRKLLNTLLQSLELTVFPANRDIYIPNCDTRGFYRKRQCRSSKGMLRGRCWCVDEYGKPVASRAGEDGTLMCTGE